MVGVPAEIPAAMNFTSLSSTSRTVLPGASPVRFATRKMCVSTAMVGCAERRVEHDVRGLASDARQRLERLARSAAPRRRAAR